MDRVGQRYLLVGLSPALEAQIREVITGCGGRIGVYVKDTLTAVIVGPDAHGDPLAARCAALGIPQWTPEHVLNRPFAS